MKPCHRPRLVPPPASCRPGPGSGEVSPEKWNPLHDEEACPCALNQRREVRRHDVSADAAAKIVGVPLRPLFRWQKIHREERLRPNSRRLQRLHRPAGSHEIKQAVLDIRSVPV